MALACGVKSGFIVLFQGMDTNGTGFGKTHLDVKDARKCQIRDLGFTSVNDFVSHICSNFTEIRRGQKGRLGLCMEVSHRAIVAYIEPKSPPGCWHVVTAIPVRRYGQASLERMRVSRSEPDQAFPRPLLRNQVNTQSQEGEGPQRLQFLCSDTDMVISRPISKCAL